MVHIDAKIGTRAGGSSCINPWSAVVAVTTFVRSTTMDCLLFEKIGKTAYVTLNRPERKNAINHAVRQGLRKAWERVNSDPDIWSVILSGGETVFSAGQDLAELADFRKHEPIEDLPLNSLETFGSMVEKPVIAAISGPCVGAGFLLSLVAGDIRIASSTATFSMPEARVGVPPSLGIPPLLAAHFPPAVISWLLLLGEPIGVEEALRFGYVNRVVSPNKLLEAAEEYASKINSLSPLVQKNTKSVINSVIAPDPKAIALSDAVCMIGRHSEDYLEGPRAFREKRTPIWKGR
jgi:enoyl-CoA hydratase/carnithine racemase